MDPLQNFFNHLYKKIVLEKPSVADQLEEYNHWLHCKSDSCKKRAEILIQNAEPEYLEFLNRYRLAPSLLKFRAMVENFTIDQILVELDKLQTTENEIR